MVFIEFISEYTDGEKLDTLINITKVKYVKSYGEAEHETGLFFYDGSSIRVCEPYKEVMRKILERTA